MKGSIYIISVIDVNVSGVVIIETPAVIVDIHASYALYPIPVIADIDLTDLGNPTIIIVVNRYVFHLNHRTIVVVLGIGTVIVTGVKGHSISLSRNIFVDREIEFPIGIY